MRSAIPGKSMTTGAAMVVQVLAATTGCGGNGSTAHAAGPQDSKGRQAGPSSSPSPARKAFDPPLSFGSDSVALSSADGAGLPTTDTGQTVVPAALSGTTAYTADTDSLQALDTASRTGSRRGRRWTMEAPS